MSDTPVTIITRNWWEHPVPYWLCFFWLDLVVGWGLSNGRFIRFGIVGGLTVPLGLGTLWFVGEVVGLHYMAAHGIALLASTTGWFILHSLWTFGDRETEVRTALVGPLVRLGGVVVHTGLLVLFTEVFGVWYVVSSALAMCLQLPMTYFLSNRFAWRRARTPGPGGSP